MLKIFQNYSKELEIIIDSINDAITIVDNNAITKYWNKAAEKMYGIKKQDIIGRNIRDFFPSSLLTRIIKEDKSYKNINSPEK